MRYALELKTLLDKAHPHVKHYVTRLEGENVKLRRQLIRLDATVLGLRSRVKALQKEPKMRTIQGDINRDDANW